MRSFLSITSLLFACFLFPISSQACSMYKVTHQGKTIVGTNEDKWLTTPHIWFETSKKGSFGCCFTGARAIGDNKYAAQSGINEYGLTFSRLASYHPELPETSSQKKITNPDLFLMDVMKTCKSVDDVYNLLNQYDRTCYLEDVIVYIEPSGKYLIVEPYKLIKGESPTLVQSNFCPSITPEEDRNRQARYKDGKAFISKGYTSTFEYCKQLSSEMHVCRDKIGDGTLLTALWDTQTKDITLFFYHDYSSKVDFNLLDELSKGDHQLEISSLFPVNREFEQLKSYITPFNHSWLRVVLLIFGIIFFFSAVIYGGSIIRKKHHSSIPIRIALFITLLLCSGYMYVLTTNIGIYYFPSPFEHHSSSLITLSSYTPWLIILMVLTILYLLFKKKHFSTWTLFHRGLIVTNGLLLLCLIPTFFYWKIISF